MLTFSTNSIRGRFDKMPMATVTLSLIAGIVISHNFAVSNWVWIVLIALSIGLSLWKNRVILLAVLGLGALLYNTRSYDTLPISERAVMTIKIADNGVDYGRYSTFSADVLHYNTRSCRARIKVTADSLTTLRRGDIIVAQGFIRPFTPQQSGYARSMARQGYSGRFTVNQNNILSWQINHHTTLHHRAVSKLKRLLPQSDGRDVAISLSLGAKMVNSGEIKQSYSYSGTSHLLAVSGLHVGMVALLFTMLLLPLSLVWRGNIIRSGVVVAIIWIYVALCGYPISAIRAAIMFSVLQLSHLVRNRYSQQNSICTTAFIMLAIEPTILFELSFSLSFIAVMAIIFVGAPISRAIHIRNAALREVAKGAIISTACVVATAPLISNSFGIISLLSIILTPIALISAQIIIISSLLSLILPASLAVTTFSAAKWVASLQNRAITWAVECGVGFVELRISDGAMVAIYTIFALLLLLGFGISHKEKDIM